MKLITQKQNIEKRVRSVLITCLGCLCALMLILLVLAWTRPGIVEEKISSYSYNHKAEVDYSVSLNSNPIYSEDRLGKGQYYLTPFVRRIDTTFTYQFNGDIDADIKGDYQVTAYLQGVQKELDKTLILWSKPYPLLAKETFQVNGKRVSLNKEIPIDLKPYNDFISRFFETYRIQTEVVLNIYWNVTVEAQTAKGPVKEKLMPVMTIPLNTKYFQITGELAPNKKGVLETTVIKPDPIYKIKVTIYGILAILFLSGLLFLRFRTESAPVDFLQQQLKKIRKEYGERLVTLDREFVWGNENIIPVKTFEDIVRVADELSKPIIYSNIQGEKSPAFCVLDEPRIFTYCLAVRTESASMGLPPDDLSLAT